MRLGFSGIFPTKDISTRPNEDSEGGDDGDGVFEEAAEGFMVFGGSGFGGWIRKLFGSGVVGGLWWSRQRGGRIASTLGECIRRERGVSVRGSGREWGWVSEGSRV